MSLNDLALVAAESGESGTHISPWLIGGLVFLLFIGALAALLAFGAGRDHS